MAGHRKPEIIQYTLPEYKIYPTARAFLECDAQVKFIRGAFGSGKSSACVQALWRCAYDQTPASDGVRYTRMAVLRGTYQQLMASSVNDWKTWIPEILEAQGQTFTYCPITRPMSGSPTAHLRTPWVDIAGFGRPADGSQVDMEVLFISCDEARDVAKLRGTQFTMIWFNEISEFPDKRIFDEATSRIRFPTGRHGNAVYNAIIGDTNPPPTSHWFYKMAEVDKPDGFRFFVQPPAVIEQEGDFSKLYKAEKKAHVVLHHSNTPYTYTINPLCENIHAYGKGEMYWLNQLHGKTRAWIKVFLMNQYGSVEASLPVFGRYDDERHCSRVKLDPLPGRPIFCGFDFGLTPACVFAQVSGVGQLRIIDEITTGFPGATSESRMNLRQFLKELFKPKLLNEYKGFPCFFPGDPIGGNQRGQTDGVTCNQILDEEGFTPEMCQDYGWQARFDAVNQFLERSIDKGHPAFLMSPACKVLREAFINGYVYQTVDPSRVLDARPVKNQYSHVADALQSVCLFVLNNHQNTLRWTRNDFGQSATDANATPSEPYQYVV